MNEVVIVSGRGGTGKTSIAASFAALANHAILVDCSVQTPNLHLLAEPTGDPEHAEYSGSHTAYIRWDLCIGCGRCAELCRYDAILPYGPPNRFADHSYVVDPTACRGCGVCAELCPGQAVTIAPATDGRRSVAQTRWGPLLHATLQPGYTDGGRLVTLLRNEAQELASREEARFIICDGAAGVGPLTAATLQNAALALIIVEPSSAAFHDLRRLVTLPEFASLTAAVCVNKFDLAEDIATRIEQFAAEAGLAILARIPYDDSFVAAQMRRASVVEHSDGPATAAVRDVWQWVESHLRPATR